MSKSSSMDSNRPSGLQSSKSFSRFEPQLPDSPRNQASTLQETKSPVKPGLNYAYEKENLPQADVFEVVGEEVSSREPAAAGGSRAAQEGYPEGFDELPIELISLADRFIASLTTAKVYATPPSIDKLSELFQDFYLEADSHIATHIQILSSRRFRDVCSTPVSSKNSPQTVKNSRKASRDTSNPSLRPEQQMLSPGEISDRRKVRRLLEVKRLALEEAIEKRVCEGIYDRIWRHRSTLDEVRDEKLRSRTAALALVGIGLKELGISLDDAGESDLQSIKLASQVEERISNAREGLLKMNEARSPLGKLQNLASTHQHIVDLLTIIHQSSSSADEILPTLIYTLITTPAEGINIISNLHFIQRFRSAHKINGEAAYCLTNLEAAITFLETVDLASLRSDEALEGPIRSSSRPPTPQSESKHSPIPPSASSTSLVLPAVSSATTLPSHIRSDSMSYPPKSRGEDKPSPPVTPSHQRRFSALFQSPANALGAASDAARTTADQGFKNISNTLDNSFKLLFGRLKEQNSQSGAGDGNGVVVVPKTLDDARKLVSPKPVIDEDGNISETSSFAEHPDEKYDTSIPRVDDRLLDLVGGRKQARDRSADSALSNASGSNRVAFATNSKPTNPETGNLTREPIPPAQTPSSSAPNATVESIRSFGSTINPLNRFASMNVMRGFGRSVTTPQPATSVAAEQKEIRTPSDKARSDIEPPLAKFVELKDAGELRVGDVAELLGDYQRLASILKDIGV